MRKRFISERIAKKLSRAGVCSRRLAEKMILDRRICVDGVVIDTPATLVNEKSIIAVDGREIAEPERERLWRHHKARGILSTNSDPKGRPTIFEKLPEELPRVMLVGRLDFNSEGLILLTNNGELARKLELPETGWTRRYRVRVHGEIVMSKLEGLEEGITISGVHYGPMSVKLEKKQNSNSWLLVTLREGKNREVRRVLKYLGLQVNRLIRVSFGPFHLGKMQSGEVREISAKVIAEQINFDKRSSDRRR
ncbi:MAG: pseudouridine synthase [Rhodospirillaceae bacterium]|mgnify:CR=1 FL=1|nr:pseudouridine synthase [Rhodospirillaceae bacterium]